MSAAEKLHYTPVEYLEIERAADNRSEYVDGEVFAMAGGTINHGVIASNLLREIGNVLGERPCLAVGSDVKVWIGAANTFTYPDVSGLCGPVDYYDQARDVYTNPSFIVEVLSDSTETYDRGGKFRRYQTLPSLREYVLVSQNEMAVEIFRRHEAGWLYSAIQSPEAMLKLDSVDCEIPIAEIYRNVEFPPPPESESQQG